MTTQLDRVYRSSNATRFPRMPSEEQALLVCSSIGSSGRTTIELYHFLSHLSLTIRIVPPVMTHALIVIFVVEIVFEFII